MYTFLKKDQKYLMIYFVFYLSFITFVRNRKARFCNGFI